MGLSHKKTWAHFILMQAVIWPAPWSSLVVNGPRKTFGVVSLRPMDHRMAHIVHMIGHGLACIFGCIVISSVKICEHFYILHGLQNFVMLLLFYIWKFLQILEMNWLIVYEDSKKHWYKKWGHEEANLWKNGGTLLTMEVPKVTHLPSAITVELI